MLVVVVILPVMCEVQSFSCTLVRVNQRLTNLVRVIERGEGRFGQMVHDVEWQSHLTAKQHKVRGESCRWLDCRPIRDEYNAEVEVRIFSAVREVENEQLDPRTVYSLNHTIALRVIKWCARLLDVLQLRELTEHVRLEVSTLVHVDDIWDSKALDNLVYENAGDCNRFLIRQFVRFCEFCKLVNDSTDVTIATLRAGEWAYNVHRDALKWCSSVHRS